MSFSYGNFGSLTQKGVPQVPIIMALGTLMVGTEPKPDEDPKSSTLSSGARTIRNRVWEKDGRKSRA